MSKVFQSFKNYESSNEYEDSDEASSISSESSKSSTTSLTYYCGCGGYCKNEKASLARHYKTKRHQVYILEYPEEND
jgi:hypothetical protein